MKKKTAIDLIAESEKTALYSISFEMDGTTEFEKFVAEFEMNSTYNGDYQRIIAALQVILDKGALERFFRPEGKMDDNVQAIPIYGGKLRLYCLRISEQIVILGNGGAKTTNSYQNDPKQTRMVQVKSEASPSGNHDGSTAFRWHYCTH